MKSIAGNNPADTSDTTKFDSQKLAQLGRAVVGKRSVQEFCKDTSLSRSLVSRLLNGSLKGPPTIRSIYRFAGTNSLIATEMLNACGYPTGAIEHLKRMPNLLMEAETESPTPAVPELAKNKTFGLSLMLTVLTNKHYGNQFNLDYHTEGTFSIQSVKEHTLVGIPAFCTDESKTDEVWREAIRLFAIALTKWNSANTCFFFLTNSEQLFAKLKTVPNINNKLSVLQTIDGYSFHSQHVIPQYGALEEEMDASVMNFPIRLTPKE